MDVDVIRRLLMAAAWLLRGLAVWPVLGRLLKLLSGCCYCWWLLLAAERMLLGGGVGMWPLLLMMAPGGGPGAVEDAGLLRAGGRGWTGRLDCGRWASYPGCCLSWWMLLLG